MNLAGTSLLAEYNCRHGISSQFHFPEHKYTIHHVLNDDERVHAGCFHQDRYTELFVQIGLVLSTNNRPRDRIYQRPPSPTTQISQINSPLQLWRCLTTGEDLRPSKIVDKS